VRETRDTTETKTPVLAAKQVDGFERMIKGASFSRDGCQSCE
jgi:hypothetical protein